MKDNIKVITLALALSIFSLAVFYMQTGIAITGLKPVPWQIEIDTSLITGTHHFAKTDTNLQQIINKLDTLTVGSAIADSSLKSQRVIRQ